jgi:GTP-binding protein HflX
MAKLVNEPTPLAYLVGLSLFDAVDGGQLSGSASLDELSRLAITAGLAVAGRYVQNRQAADSHSYVGAGALDQLVDDALARDANVLLFDDQLEPTQLRNIEQRIPESLQVIDRTALILDIFARHATSRDGKLQVELAQLEYRLPRLTRMWTHMARQAGGGPGGGRAGVGLRGPGETQLEVDRRRIGQRLTMLRKSIRGLAARQEEHRARRGRSGLARIAVVGYTNAGKTTLMDRLLASGGATVSRRSGANQLFATLDPLTRRLELGDGRVVLLTDTVGFVQKLPHQLVAAFRSTLTEAVDADLLLHVVDVSHPQSEQQRRAAEAVLSELGGDRVPRITVMNKADRLPAGSVFAHGMGDDVVVSATTGAGIEALTAAVRRRLDSGFLEIRADIPYAKAGLVQMLRAGGTIHRSESHETGLEVHAAIPEQVIAQLRRNGVTVAEVES